MEEKVSKIMKKKKRVSVEYNVCCVVVWVEFDICFEVLDWKWWIILEFGYISYFFVCGYIYMYLCVYKFILIFIGCEIWYFFCGCWSGCECWE